MSSVSFVGKTKTPSLHVCHLAWKTSARDVEASSASFAEKMPILSILVAPEPKGLTCAKPNPRIPAMGSTVPMVCKCAWEQDVKSCVETKCHGCGGEQCQLCRQDANTIAACCDDHYHSVTPPKMCIDSKEEAVTGCFDTKCRGCGGEQCQLCREDAKSQCCTGAMLL